MKIKFQTILSKESASSSSTDYYYIWSALRKGYALYMKQLQPCVTDPLNLA